AFVSLNGFENYYPATANLYNVKDVTNPLFDSFRLGSDTNYGYSFSGQINDAIIFDHQLSLQEMTRVQTYLALKYGTTLSGGTRSYLDTKGNVVWDITTNAGYNHNIAGIAQDDVEAFSQKQS